MAKGGARPGAGRPAGITSRSALCDQLTSAQIEALVSKAIDKANDGNSLLIKFMQEKIFGTAPQPLRAMAADQFKSKAFRFQYAAGSV